VARFQHLHAICIQREANVGNRRTIGRLVILVGFINLIFDPEADTKRASNVKSVPLNGPTRIPGRLNQAMRNRRSPRETAPASCLIRH
jgi:hypothetical protein